MNRNLITALSLALLPLMSETTHAGGGFLPGGSFENQALFCSHVETRTRSHELVVSLENGSAPTLRYKDSSFDFDTFQGHVHNFLESRELVSQVTQSSILIQSADHAATLQIPTANVFDDAFQQVIHIRGKRMVMSCRADLNHLKKLIQLTKPRSF